MKNLISALTLLIFCSVAAADDHDSLKASIEAAMKSDVRTEQERERDRNRMPVQTLEFFGLQKDMKILELLPGGGWYTKILVPVMADEGSYYAAIGTGRIKDRLGDTAGFEGMNIVAEDAKVARPEGSRFYNLELTDLGVSDLDMVLTFRNYHNFTESGRMAMNEAAFAALKPGGIYAVVDHTRRHMEGDSDENRRRIDPVLAIKEILAAGFELVDFSDLHYRADDELEYEVGRRSVSGNTDRWTIKFRKPE